jgi:hypothetical protein
MTVYVRKVPLAFATVSPPVADALDRGEQVDAATAEVVCEACIGAWVKATAMDSYAAWGAEAGDGGPFDPGKL